MADDADEWVTAAEVARHFRVSARTVYRWADSGHLRAQRLGPGGRTVRIHRSELHHDHTTDQASTGAKCRRQRDAAASLPDGHDGRGAGRGPPVAAGAGLDARPGWPAGSVLPPGDTRCDPVSRGRTAARVLLERVAGAHHRLALVWADGGYTGSLVEHCLATFALVLAIVKRSDDMRGFVVLPKRWIVERLFAYLIRSRRLVRDFERCTTSAEAMVYWSMTMIMTRRLARSHSARA